MSYHSGYWMGMSLPLAGICGILTFKPPHDKTNKMTCAPSEDSDQPGHAPSLTRVFSVCFKGTKDPALLQADSKDAQADPSLHWVQKSFCTFCRALAHFIFITPSERWSYMTEILLTGSKQMNKCKPTLIKTTEPPHDKTNKMACTPSEDSDQPGHLPSLIRWMDELGFYIPSSVFQSFRDDKSDQSLCCPPEESLDP